MAYSQTQGAEGGGEDIVLFGLSLTPAVLGIAVAVIGTGAAGFLAVQFLKPKFDEYKELESTVAEKQAQLERVAEERKRVASTLQKLEEAKNTQERVLALFPKEETVSVLPLDLNRIVSEQYGRLTRFEPAEGGPALVNDSSWGESANGKIEQQTVDVEFEGNFDQTGNILRKIERYQSMLAIDNLSSTLEVSNQAVSFNPKTGQLEPKGEPEVRLNTAFTLKVLTPVSAEDLAAEAAAAEAPAEGEAAEGEAATE